jgi:hypothetical protein
MSIKPMVASSGKLLGLVLQAAGILDHLTIGFEDLRVFVRVLVEVLGDGGGRVARLDDVVLDPGALARTLQSVDIYVGDAQRIAGNQHRFLHRLVAGGGSTQPHQAAGRIVVDAEPFDAFQRSLLLFSLRSSGSSKNNGVDYPSQADSHHPH